MEASTSDPIPEQPPLPPVLQSARRVWATYLLHRLYLALGVLSDLLFSVINWRRPRVIAPVRHPILLRSATALARDIREQRCTSRQVVLAFIQRLDEVDRVLNCVTERRFEEALLESSAADEEVRSARGEYGSEWQAVLAERRPLLGVPFTAKDSIAIGGMRQTGGLWLWRDNTAESDAETVRLLREAGAIPLAHTNVPELGMWWETVNTIYGRTRNPYVTSRTCGGSSGGEAALLSACGTPLSLGSDIGGSIRMPAFFCGVYGLKPSACAVSNTGHLMEPVGSRARMLVIGPLCRHAEDLLPLYRVLSLPEAAWRHRVRPESLSDLRVFYMADAGPDALSSPVHPQLTAAHEQLCLQLEQRCGVRVRRLHVAAMSHQLRLWLYSMRSDKSAQPFAVELTGRRGAISPLGELVRWLGSRSSHTAAAIVLAQAEKAMTLEDDYGLACQQLKQYWNEVLGEDGVLLYPTHPTPAPYHNQPLLKSFNFSYTAIFNALELPALQVPLGVGEWGVPLGIQVVAANMCDHLCVMMAEEIEKLAGGWVCPAPVQLESADSASL